MVNELERVFGSPAATSLPGIVQDAVNSATLDLLTGTSGAQTGATVARGLLRRQKDVDKKEAVKTFIKILEGK